MTMAQLISKRAAESARNLSRQPGGGLSPRVGSGIDAARAALEAWEAEGGASAGVPQGEYAASRPLSLERLLLERLGAALVGEWNNLPAALQRAVYERAVGGSSLSRLTMRRQMARFLHNHKQPRPA